jgi:phage-related baseplate assembly protein
MAKQAKSGSTSLTTSDPPPAVEDVNQVFEWIVSGHSEHHILDAINSQLAGQAARPLIDAAWVRICQTGEAPLNSIIAWAIEASRMSFQKLIETGDFAGALRAAKQVVDLAERRPLPMDESEAD